MEIHLEDEHVKLIRPDRDDVWSKGYICPKGTTLGHLHEDPDRIRTADDPRRRHVARGDLGRGVRPLRGALHGVLERARHRRGRPRSSATRSGHSFTLGRYVRAAHRAVGHPAHLLGGHRRPVAEERLVRPHVREHVEDPVARHPAHRLPGHAWAATRRRRAARCSRCPDVLGEIDAIRDARRQGRRGRPAPHRHRRPRRRVAADPARHRRRVPAGDVQRALRRGPRRPRRARRHGRRASTTCARVVRRLHARSRSPTFCRVPAETIRRIAREFAAAPTRRRSTAASGCATRSSARSPRGWSTWSTSSPATSTSRAA